MEAVTLLFRSFAKAWSGKSVTVFIDNTVTQGSVVNGYNRSRSDLGPAMNAHIHGVWARIANHGINAWFERVSTK